LRTFSGKTFFQPFIGENAQNQELLTARVAKIKDNGRQVCQEIQNRSTLQGQIGSIGFSMEPAVFVGRFLICRGAFFLAKLIHKRVLKSAFFAGDADPLFHLIEIFGEGTAAGRGQAVFGARDAAFEKFYAGNVLRFFELAGVDTEVAVRGFEHALEIIEAERVVGGEGTDDAEADALMNEAIQFWEFRSAGGKMLAGLLASGITKPLPGLGFGLSELAGWKRSSHRASVR
jgi:hypothetical protein